MSHVKANGGGVAVGFVSRTQCPACGDGSARTLYRRPFDQRPVREYLELFYQGRVPLKLLKGGEYHLAQCTRCGLAFQTDVLNDDGMGLLYGSWIDPDRSIDIVEGRLPRVAPLYVRTIYRLASYGVRPGPDCTILDYGCGWGHLLMAARAFGYNAIGVEISGERREYLRSQGIPCYASLDEVPVKADYVNCDQVLEHLPKPREALARLADACKEGGIIKLSVPDARKALRRLARRPPQDADALLRLNAVAPLEHINAFTPRSLMRMGLEVGLTPLRPPHRDMIEVAAPLVTLRAGARSVARWLVNRLFPVRGTTQYFRKGIGGELPR